ncbi:MAG TPA: hypothetical protein VKE49_00405, partial [Myxococcaceae bacterium]|nr:hypothetical protein [Myxococcaceae bacterium]
MIIQPGAIATATVTAVRAPSDEGPIEIAIQGAPDGVSVDAPAIPAGANAAQITLRNQCTGDPLNGAPVTVRGTVGGRSASAGFSISVRCLAAAEPSLSTLAGAPGASGNGDGDRFDARFFGPVSVVGDGAGNLYVADALNNSIRKIDLSTGAVTTIAGSRTRGFADGTGSEARFNGP